MSSNNSTIATINLPRVLSQYLSLSLGFIILISGIIGNCFNILIFLTIKNYKTNACSQYMLAGSIFSLLFLLIGLITRTLSQGFYLDFTLTNRIWCKLRSSFLDIISFCTFSCICLQSIDIFFITSRSVVMRQKSNVKISRFLLICCILFWSIHEIPSFVFQDLVFTNGLPTCIKTNANYILYHTYGATLVLSNCVPVAVISFFAYHIYKHLKTANLGHISLQLIIVRQMTRMVSFQIGIVLLFQFPFAVATVYFLGTTYVVKNPERQLEDKLTQTFFNIYVYGLYASPFYCYYASSKRFRHQVVEIIKKFIRKRRRNHIQPTSHYFRQTTTRQQTIRT